MHVLRCFLAICTITIGCWPARAEHMLPISAETPVYEYEFVPGEVLVKYFRHGEKGVLLYQVLKLDKTGALIPNPLEKPLKIPPAAIVECNSKDYNHPMHRMEGENEPVYEYRSGLLIKGELNWNFEFVPEKGSTVIAMEDYEISDASPRIYNLPGTFRLKAKKPAP
jgi:hypothetical protein